ncbi:MAG: radical SAM family heme chaperone HemW [Ruminococcaceae bacterium]|nr:radical SAM family heme chaperone HemW [Oscillospiraceae bacterium]
MNGIYIHIPFCKSKCPYCDFYSLRTNEDLNKQYVEALIDEITNNTRFKKHFNTESFQADTIYLGGGTPSVLTGEDIYNIITSAKTSYNISENAEITVECNPNSDIEALIPYFKKCGVNRISLGMQSAVDKERKKLGRSADKQRIFDIINAFKTNEIDNISLDIMLGVPEQTLETLKETLDFIKECDVKHISAYILNLEENTPFYKMQDKLNLPDENTVCDFYECTSDYLKNIGFEHYEISNFALPGYESKHNTKYWLLDNYLGLGPSAHSFLNGKRYYFPDDIKTFIYGESPVFDCDGGDVEEYIMLRLRLKQGLKLNELNALYGESPIKNIFKKAPLLKEQGLVYFDGESISLTEKGFLVSNSVISEFI